MISVFGIVATCEKVSVAVAFTYHVPVRAESEVSQASTGCFVASATVILAVPSKATPLIVRAVVSFGAETMVIAGVVVGVAIVASAVADETLVTVPDPPEFTHAVVPLSHTHTVSVEPSTAYHPFDPVG